ncbi:CBS domain-containing protein [Bradyrhizobium sp. USDA 377]
MFLRASVLRRQQDMATLPMRVELHQIPARITIAQSGEDGLVRLTWVKPHPDGRTRFCALKFDMPAEFSMRAHQIMTRSVISVTPDTSIVEAANIMLKRHVSGLTVVDEAGRLVGVVSEGDFIRRSEIGTGRKRGRWLRFILGPGTSASDFVQEHGRKVAEVMTPSPVTITEDTALAEIVDLMERNNVKRLPVVRGDMVVGIVSRANLLQAVAGLARDVPDPTADDDHIRSRIIDAMEKNDWCPFGLNVIVRDGIVHLSGVITEERARQAAVVAAETVEGVKKVHDHLCWVDTMSGVYLNSPEDDDLAKAS